MRKLFFALLSVLLIPMNMMAADGWPKNYGGVMLQGFYWDSFADSKWKTLEKQADELSEYFSLIWIPQSGNCGGTSMGYNPKYYWDQNSTFGTEAQLRSMISTFKSKGLGTIADVVINHRQNLSTWVDFPAETYNGVTYQMVSTDICLDDDGGETAKHTGGLSLSPNKDSGEGWDGMRDLDHASENVQKSIFAYEDFLLNDLGYTGFRYDVGKGFAAKYFGLYNSKANPEFSVGEVWDNNQTIKNWIDGTKTDGTNTFTEPQSGAFDFQMRYQVRDAINNNDWTKIAGSNCLVYNSSYRRYAVTFVENHDTEYRSSTAQQDPIKKDTLAANAVIIAMPGTPCVFFKHWQAYKKEIKLMIEARKLVGINNESSYFAVSSLGSRTALQVSGSNGDLIVVAGPDAAAYTRDGWKVLTSGYHYQYLVKDDFDTSGWQAIVDRVNKEAEESGTTDEDFETPVAGYTFNAYFLAPADWKNTIQAWVWDHNNGDKNYTGGTWPGEDCYKIGKAEDGRYIWQWCYYGNLTSTPTHIIFNNSGSPQTADMSFTDGGWYQGSSTKADPSLGIEDVELNDNSQLSIVNSQLYNLTGQKVDNDYKGIVIVNGKKYLKK